MEINYRRASETDSTQIHQLIKDYIYFSSSFELEDALSLITTYSYVAVSGDSVIGFSSLVEKSHDVLKGGMLVVHPDFRGKGIGKRLSLIRFDGIKDKTVVTNCWIHPTIPGEVTSDVLLKKVGFVDILRYEHPWKSECNPKEFCEHHDSDGCHCDVKILAKHF